MQVVTFPVKKNADLSVLLKVIKKFGYTPRIEDELEIKMNNRQSMVKYSRSYKRLVVKEKELSNLINEATAS